MTMAFDSQQIRESDIFSFQGKFSSESMFSSPQSNFMKDPNLQEVLFKDSETIADEVSVEADDLDLGYDTTSELSSPMSAKSDWGETSTTSSAVESCHEEDLFAVISDEETRNSLFSILEEDTGTGSCGQWSQASPQLSPSGPIECQVPNTTTYVPSDFTGIHMQIQSRSHEVEETSTPPETAKPVRKRTAASLSDCGLTPRKRPRKFPSLIQALSEKQNGCELQILVQPEKHHRARYRTEGSRGSVKDDSGDNFPKLKLIGVNEPVTLQVFVGTDQGKVRPHGYYQACKVTGRNTTPCEEKDVDGTTVLDVPWEPVDGKMEMSVDCIGILKLRNADVEQRIGPLRSKRKSTCVRLVYRVSLPSTDGGLNTLQIVSRSITCTQPLGHPEIVKKSLTECSVAGGEELFIIGKNFTSKANTEVKLRQLDDANGKVTWEGDCEVDKSLFQNNHIVCKIPPYPNQNLKTPVTVHLVVTGKPNQCSDLEAHPIKYIPLPEVASTVEFRNEIQDANGLATFLPPTPTSPSAATLLMQGPASTFPGAVKVEPTIQVIQQQPPTPSPQTEQDEFSLALQLMAAAYLKNKDMYNNLLIQTQSQVPASTESPDSSSQVMDILNNN